MIYYAMGKDLNDGRAPIKVYRCVYNTEVVTYVVSSRGEPKKPDCKFTHIFTCDCWETGQAFAKMLVTETKAVR